jgi:hypothetical protein
MDRDSLVEIALPIVTKKSSTITIYKEPSDSFDQRLMGIRGPDGKHLFDHGDACVGKSCKRHLTKNNQYTAWPIHRE